MSDDQLRKKGKRLVEDHYNEALHGDLTPKDFLLAIKKKGSDVEGLQATKHISNFFRSKKAKTNDSTRKIALFKTDVNTESTKTKQDCSNEDSTKTDYKIVAFNGCIKGVNRRHGFCYIHLQHGHSTSFSFGADGQSLIVKITRPAYFWKDLVHSSYDLPEKERHVERDPYKIAISQVFSPVPEVETLIINVGEDIMEATDKLVELKNSSEEEETWGIHCVPFLYKDNTYEKKINV